MKISPPTQADPVSTALAEGSGPGLSNVRLEIRGDQVAVLTFDHPDSSANILDQKTLDDLDAHLRRLEVSAGLRGLILTTSKPTIFIAGADVNALASLKSAPLENYLNLGQTVMNRLSWLPFPVVSAIHGACVGGGLEVALAGDWRVASDDPSTKLGLPETQLGILPAWGGSTRLPRLVGLPAALSLILPGKTLSAEKALRRKLVDSVVDSSHLLEEALLFLERGKRSHSFHPTNVPPIAGLIRRRARRSLLKTTRGNYPAPLKALDVVSRGGWGSVSASLAREREAVLALAEESVTENLIRVFGLQQAARKTRVNRDIIPVPEEVRRTGVIGAGVMGAGIAQWVSSRGVSVLLRDVGEDQLAEGMGRIHQLYTGGVKRGLFNAHDAKRREELVVPTVETAGLGNLDLIIEAAVENLDLKKKIFRELSQKAAPTTILATNTSALPIHELARDPQIQHPERILGLHFFNPVHRMKLVEVVVTPETAPEYVEGALRFVKSIGKLPVVVQDSPGFLVNRILMPYLIEAGRLFEAGLEVDELDTPLLNFGMPMGPLRLLDEVGLDVALHVASTMSEAFEGRMVVPPILSRMVEAGMLGKKAGRGFFTHGDGKAVPNEWARELRSEFAHLSMTEAEITDLLTLLMVDEGSRCVEEELVRQVSDVDLAMIMGTGWAPFRGGPLRYADSLSFPELMDRYRAAQEAAGHYFVPSDLLSRMSRSARGFYASD